MDITDAQSEAAQKANEKTYTLVVIGLVVLIIIIGASSLMVGV